MPQRSALYVLLLKLLLFCVTVSSVRAIPSQKTSSFRRFTTIKKDSAMSRIQKPDRAVNWNLDGNFEGAFIPKGAIKKGIVYDQLIHADAILHTKPLGLWSGGRLLISAVQIMSGRPSANYIGDLQVASNIAAKTSLRIYEFSYTQDFSRKFVISAGLIDMNKFFVKDDHASILLNSSFGMEPDISANVPVSIFPKPGFGISAAKYFTHWKIQGSLFQNNPSDRSDLSLKNYMATLEIDFRTHDGLGGKPVIYKFGVWHHSRFIGRPGGLARTHSGYYFIAQQTIRSQSIRNTGIFLQWGSSPLRISTVPYYLGLGLLMDRPFSSRPSDQFSVGMAKAWTNIRFDNAETAFEVTYLFHADNLISIQPDIQYIRNPGGLLNHNALVFFLRGVITIH